MTCKRAPTAAAMDTCKREAPHWHGVAFRMQMSAVHWHLRLESESINRLATRPARDGKGVGEKPGGKVLSSGVALPGLARESANEHLNMGGWGGIE